MCNHEKKFWYNLFLSDSTWFNFQIQNFISYYKCCFSFIEYESCLFFLNIHELHISDGLSADNNNNNNNKTSHQETPYLNQAQYINFIKTEKNENL